jgi:hypothetical protein
MSAPSQEGPAEPESTGARAVSCGDLSGPDAFQQALRRYNHRCRNSLSAIKMGLYLFERESTLPMTPRFSELSLVYEDVERLFDRLQMIYRTSGLTWVRSPLGQLISERVPSWRAWFSARGRNLEIDLPLHDDPGDFDPMYLGSGLDAFAAWRASVGNRGRHSRLSWQIHAGCFEIFWNEPAHPAACGVRKEREGHSERPEALASTDSVALLLLERVASAHGGHLETSREPSFGVKVCWPQICRP